MDYKLQCDQCSIRNSKEGVKNDDKTVAHYWGEVSRSAAERSAEHVNGYKRKQEDNPMYKHKILHHAEEEVTFTMSIVKRHQTPLPRMVLESCLIEMGEKNGSLILNSKNS